MQHRVRPWLAVAVSLCAVAPHALAQAADPDIEWRVQNRFPVFQDAADFERIETFWSTRGTSSAVVDAQGFTKSLRVLLPISRTAWDAATGTYDKKVLFRDQHMVLASVRSASPDLRCEWLLDGSSVGTTPCAKSPAFPIGAGKRFTITAQVSDGRRLSTGDVAIAERLIVAMGDSFASGEGNPDHPAVLRAVSPDVHWPFAKNAGRHVLEDAAWWDEACHRSLLSWPALTALRLAVENPREVVQFASFACSGAEVYDGMLRAQVNPPGWQHAYLNRDMRQRDGGAGYRWNGDSYVEPQCTGGGCRSLKLSQLSALADLLCPDAAIRRDPVPGPALADGIHVGQVFFGTARLPRCDAPRKVDRLLLSVGGNDSGFSGIVRWLITPPNGKSVLNTFFLSLARQNMGVIEPTQARKSIDHLPALYEQLSSALKRLGIQSQHAVLLEYPDPTTGNEELQQCNARTRDGNATFQALVRHSLGNPDFLFGINPKEYRAVRRSFIEPLQAAQRSASSRLGWQIVSSQEAFRSPDGSSRGYCAVTAPCIMTSCPKGDLTRWWGGMYYATEPRMTSLADFDAYDASRRRGMRYGVDAVLTSAARAPDGSLQRNWLTSTAHPTGNAHARIADIVHGAIASAPARR
jgi:hypothetical protein